MPDPKYAAIASKFVDDTNARKLARLDVADRIAMVVELQHAGIQVTSPNSDAYVAARYDVACRSDEWTDAHRAAAAEVRKTANDPPKTFKVFAAGDNGKMADTNAPIQAPNVSAAKKTAPAGTVVGHTAGDAVKVTGGEHAGKHGHVFEDSGTSHVKVVIGGQKHDVARGHLQRTGS